MVAPKVYPMSFRFPADITKLLKKASDSEHRSQANFLEKLIIDYCKSNSITLSEDSDSTKPSKPAKSKK